MAALAGSGVGRGIPGLPSTIPQTHSYRGNAAPAALEGDSRNSFKSHKFKKRTSPLVSDGCWGWGGGVPPEVDDTRAAWGGDPLALEIKAVLKLLCVGLRGAMRVARLC